MTYRQYRQVVDQCIERENIQCTLDTECVSTEKKLMEYVCQKKDRKTCKRDRAQVIVLELSCLRSDFFSTYEFRFDCRE